MAKTERILHDLKKAGHRLTRIRKAIVETLSESEAPLSAFDLKSRLNGKAIEANKTTVYREAAFLAKFGVLHEIQFGDGKTRYRICPVDHHHHTICLRCSRVQDVQMKNDLESYEKRLGRGRKFKVLYHTLEFFGVCGDCNG